MVALLVQWLRHDPEAKSCRQGDEINRPEPALFAFMATKGVRSGLRGRSPKLALAKPSIFTRASNKSDFGGKFTFR
jgi:hypothetical protein